ncbi:MAG: FAD-binding oxidoreductase, partial [Alphaproteobacteria bacterium]|nr:FAD-binding oxidoreductase [Alphaproteobacteria bacterium]
MTGTLPQQANIVIIGGGAIGCSIAYHLAKMGVKDILLLEKSGLTHGSTWHAAGLVGQLRPSRNVTRMLQASVALYDQIEEETGQNPDWKKVGSLRLASSQNRWTEIKRAATTAKSFGLEMHLISPKEAQDMFPIMTTDGVVGAAYIPSDGYIDPSGITQALAKGARMNGAAIVEGVRVTGIELTGRRATAVLTDQGRVRAEIIVNAAGMWGRDIGALAGVNIPSVAVEHQYLITEQIPGLPKGMPTMRDPDHLLYYKPEVNGFVVGGFEANPAPFGRDGMPQGFARELLPSNFDQF